MQLRQLECFRVLMTAGTMTRAAQIMGVSQPAVSTMIAALEHEIGFALFDRRAGRVQPTEEGRLFYTQATRSLEAIDAARRAAMEIKDGRRGTLTIAAYPGLSISFLPRMLAAFGVVRPNVRIRLVSRSSYIVKDSISTQQFDLSIAEIPVDHPENRMDRFSYRCLCMLPKRHPLASKKTLTPSNLDGVPFISLFRDHQTYMQLAAAFSKYGAEWNVVAETQYFASACELVANNLGVGIVDPLVSAPFTSNTVLRRFEPEIRYEIAILYPLDGRLSKLASEFRDILRSNLGLHQR